MKKYPILLFAFLPILTYAQLTGTIQNAKGEPLPFANVYIEGTTQGTTANTEGVYFFDVKNGSYHIVFQYVGYKKKIEIVEIKGKTVLNIRLESDDLELKEVVIKANAEDPAYAMIRKAQELRKTYRDQVPNYACDVYIKGLQQIADAPKKILGQDIGDMGGILDTVGGKKTGIVYLSETISRYNVQGAKRKEELKLSKVSGNPNGFGFNRAELFDFSFYDNNITLTRPLLSPIGDGAMSYYKYRFAGSFRDTMGYMVNKIEVIPKRKEDPVWSGYLYLVDNQWNIYSTDLYCTGKAMQVDFVDTISLRQTHVPTGNNIWRPISQTLSFKFGIFGIKIKGYFTGIFSNYDLNPTFTKGYFGNEVYVAKKAESNTDTSVWNTVRPIELTQEEQRDYVRKDSIRAAHLTPQYLDSVDRKNNKFKIINLLAGYSYRNSQKKTTITWLSPLTSIEFNPVQGWTLGTKLNMDKYSEKVGEPYKTMWSLRGDANYGFAEKILRGSAGASYQFNRFTYPLLSIDAGVKVAQFNENEPITSTIAELYAVYDKKHLRYLFNKKFVKIGYSQDIANGLRLTVGWETAIREQDLVVNSQYSFKKKGEAYNPNTVGFQTDLYGTAHVAKANLTWTPANKYATYPHYKENEGSKYPIFSATIEKAFDITGSNADFTKLGLGMTYNNISMGIWGNSELRGSFKTFLNKTTSLNFVDYNHLNGNQTFINNTIHYMNGFMRMNYYNYSATESTLTAHWQHHFNGYILDKIPLIRKLRFGEVARVAYAYTPQYGNYLELGFGVDKIGWGLFRFVRVDVVWQKSFENNTIGKKPMVMVGINLN
jgi:hypothetical protein